MMEKGRKEEKEKKFNFLKGKKRTFRKEVTKNKM